MRAAPGWAGTLTRHPSRHLRDSRHTAHGREGRSVSRPRHEARARGKRVDKRVDIWAFGVLLYERLTGEHVFNGETTSDTLAAVIKTEPN